MAQACQRLLVTRVLIRRIQAVCRQLRPKPQLPQILETTKMPAFIMDQLDGRILGNRGFARGVMGISTRILLLLFLLVGVAVQSGCDTGGNPGTSVTASIDTNTDRRPLTDLSAEDDTLRDPRFPIVNIVTNLGTIRVQLDLEQAPITGKNFLWYAGNGHYNGTVFHQIVPGYMALGGGYTEQFEEKPTQFWIRNEAFNGLKNRKGTIAMARRPDQADSSTCQFFFNLVDNPHLDHRSRENAKQYGYCVFGRVIEGMDVLDKMNQLPVQDQGLFPSVPTPAVVIERVGT